MTIAKSVACATNEIKIYQPPAGGNGVAVLVSTKTVDTTISALSWDPTRNRVWAAYNDTVYLIDIGDPTVSGPVVANLQFPAGVGGTLIDGLAYDINDDTLYYSPDVDLNVYQFSLGTGVNPPLGTLMETIAPEDAGGNPDGLVSGVAIGAGNTLYIGRNGAAEIRHINKTTGAFISQFTTTAGRVEDLVCDPVTYSPLEAILAKDSNQGIYEAFEVEPGTCPLIGECEPCDPMTQGFWRRICAGVVGKKSNLHPATPEDFDPVNCDPLLAKGKDRKDPCIKAEAQNSALLYNIMYGYMAECCEFCDSDGNIMTAAEARDMVRQLIDSGECKAAAALADSANNKYDTCDQ
jgi:hypothetical protein